MRSTDEIRQEILSLVTEYSSSGARSHAAVVNSGSSANLLAFMTLTSPLLKERAIQRGDEVICVAAAFPTTVTPILQYGAVLVFVDVRLGTYNIDVSMLEIVLTASMGNFPKATTINMSIPTLVIT